VQVVTKRIKMEGMIVGDYYSDKELMHEFQTDMARYVQEGQVKVFEHVTEGIANAGRAFIEVSWLWRVWFGCMQEGNAMWLLAHLHCSHQYPFAHAKSAHPSHLPQCVRHGGYCC
jgi:hypothetical protein